MCFPCVWCCFLRLAYDVAMPPVKCLLFLICAERCWAREAYEFITQRPDKNPIIVNEKNRSLSVPQKLSKGHAFRAFSSAIRRWNRFYSNLHTSSVALMAFAQNNSLRVNALCVMWFFAFRTEGKLLKLFRAFSSFIDAEHFN